MSARCRLRALGALAATVVAAAGGAAVGTTALFAALLASPARAQPAQAAASAPSLTVRGVAWDSLRNEALGGAVIAAIGTGRTTLSDPRGRFQLDSVPAGTWEFTMNHAALDALGLSGVSSRLEVGAGRTDIRLAIPSFATFWRAACAGAPPRDSVYVYGIVRTPGGRAPVRGATVELAWLDVGTRGKQVTQATRAVSTTTDGNGAFAFCGAPPGALRIRATSADAASGIIDLLPGAPRIAWRDLTVGPVSATAPAEFGTISGVVMRAEGAPLGGARIVMDGIPEVRTDTLGRFTLPNVPTGTQQFQVQAVGLTPVLQVVDVAANEPARVFVNMEKVTTLDAALVVGTPIMRRFVAAIDERRSQGLGHFVDSTDLRGRMTMRSAFDAIPSAKVSGRPSRQLLTLRRNCAARVYIDNVDQRGQETLWMLTPEDVAVIEVYQSVATTPFEFQGPRGSGCVVAIWTKRFVRP